MWELWNVYVPNNFKPVTLTLSRRPHDQRTCIEAIRPFDHMEARRPGVARIDGRGLHVFPALTDTHCHARVPGDGTSERPDSFFGAAMAGGVGQVCLMPNTNPSISTYARVDELYQAMGPSRVDYRIWFGATPTNTDEIALTVNDPRVVGVKMYMGSSTGSLLVQEEQQQLRIFEFCASKGITVAVHAEDEDMMVRIRSELGREPSLSDHCKIRQTRVEVSAVRRALRLAKQAGCRVHFCHLSTPEAVELVFDAKQAGLRATVEVCLHHLLFDESYLARPNGALFKMNPPLRTPAQVHRLLEMITQGDLVDIVATDHAPHTLANKQRTAYDEIPSGVTGVQSLFPVMMSLVQAGVLTLERMWELTVRNPGYLLKLNPAASLDIQAGQRRDLVLYNPNDSHEISNEEQKTRCGWTPYQGMKVCGVPQAVIMGGEVVLGSSNMYT